MSADVTPLRPDWPQIAPDDDPDRQWWLPYNAGYLDGVRSILERLGLVGVDLGKAEDAVRLAANEPQISLDKARLHLHAVPS